MLLLVDNGSIFTKDIVSTLSNSDIPFDQKSFDQINFDDISNYDSFILSGRRNNDSQMNAKNSKIILHAVNEKKNLLGICYGAEILALTLGGTIKKSLSLQKGNETISVLKNNLVSEKSMNVFESHNFEIAKMPSVLVSLAKSNNCKYEIIQYENKFIFGTQFHPEMSPDGHNLIEKFCLL